MDQVNFKPDRPDFSASEARADLVDGSVPDALSDAPRPEAAEPVFDLAADIVAAVDPSPPKAPWARAPSFSADLAPDAEPSLIAASIDRAVRLEADADASVDLAPKPSADADPAQDPKLTPAAPWAAELAKVPEAPEAAPEEPREAVVARLEERAQGADAAAAVAAELSASPEYQVAPVQVSGFRSGDLDARNGAAAENFVEDAAGPVPEGVSFSGPAFEGGGAGATPDDVNRAVSLREMMAISIDSEVQRRQGDAFEATQTLESLPPQPVMAPTPDAGFGSILDKLSASRSAAEPEAPLPAAERKSTLDSWLNPFGSGPSFGPSRGD